jgi:molybdopterin synthase sulfur carrier subunit
MSIDVKLNLLGVLDVRQGELFLDLPPDTTLGTVIEMIDQHNPGFKEAVIGSDGGISPQFVFFVNGRNANHLAGNGTRLNGGDVINVIPAIAGG